MHRYCQRYCTVFQLDVTARKNIDMCANRVGEHFVNSIFYVTILDLAQVATKARAWVRIKERVNW